MLYTTRSRLQARWEKGGWSSLTWDSQKTMFALFSIGYGYGWNRLPTTFQQAIGNSNWWLLVKWMPGWLSWRRVCPRNVPNVLLGYQNAEFTRLTYDDLDMLAVMGWCRRERRLPCSPLHLTLPNHLIPYKPIQFNGFTTLVPCLFHCTRFLEMEGVLSEHISKVQRFLRTLVDRGRKGLFLGGEKSFKFQGANIFRPVYILTSRNIL